MEVVNFHAHFLLLLGCGCLPGCAGMVPGFASGDAPETKLAGMIEDAGLPELSGLAASVRSPGMWWALNDSGNPARLFMLDSQGQTRAVWRVPGAENVDWEDLACAVGPGGESFLWIADTGDAGGARAGGVIYRVREPEGRDGGGATETAAAFPFVWPDGPRDCECLLVDGGAGEGLLVTKLFFKPGRAEVYQFKLPAGPASGLTLLKVPDIDVESVAALRTLTGGSVSRDGRRVVVRSYTQGWSWQRLEGEPLVACFRRPGTGLALPALLQGEAIAFTPDGGAVMTASERLPSPFYQTRLVGQVSP